MKLSVVTGTLNRLKYLQACVASIGPACAGIEHEIIIVDGGSTDGTLEWLRARRDIITIEQGYAAGAVKAFNAGFWAAEGEYVASLNDDCTVRGNTLHLACDYLDVHPETGQVAIPWADKGHHPPSVQTAWIGKQQYNIVYANFGVTRRSVGDVCGWWGDWEHYGGDAELSYRIWDMGLFVDELKGGEIEHLRVHDSTRRVCYANQAFFERWYTIDVSHIIKMIEGRNGKSSLHDDSLSV